MKQKSNHVASCLLLSQEDSSIHILQAEPFIQELYNTILRKEEAQF